MNQAASHRVLVLGATGKTGARVVGKLSERGVSVRTATRTGAGARFDWDATRPRSSPPCTKAYGTEHAPAEVALRAAELDPADYGEALRALTETIASGHGSRPNGGVLTVTGARPTSLAELAAETAPAWEQR